MKKEDLQMLLFPSIFRLLAKGVLQSAFSHFLLYSSRFWISQRFFALFALVSK